MSYVFIVAAVLAVLSAVILAGGCKTKDSSGDDTKKNANAYRQISQEKAREMMAQNDGHVVIDVRRADEYESGHIPGAVCIPNESIGTDVVDGLDDPAQIILVYCRSGRRSKEAASKLAALGYENVYEFGGIIEWTWDTVAGAEPGEFVPA